ncbi:MAG: hypothetical protein B6D39_04155 [Anaerolineae bacterium UTCFX2]|jgi:hypothetical membrane protein|nr:hypothetical protein [Anaerolineales bacterium]OQY92764.1 MAG: hypothetical protein B6D39_04155 [Anaerolineae bacterium UTCFX2]
MKIYKDIRLYIYIIAIGITSFMLMIWITPFGSGVSPDSVTYIEGAKSLLSGQGYSRDGSPITHFPPLYSLFLAIVGIFKNDLVQASR